jgi:uncharacterized protein YukE
MSSDLVSLARGSKWGREGRDSMKRQDPQTSLWPTYALRAWLTAVQGQTERAQRDVERYVEYHESEAARFRDQAERASNALESLGNAISLVDDALRQARDTAAEQERGPSEVRRTQRSSSEGPKSAVTRGQTARSRGRKSAGKDSP